MREIFHFMPGRQNDDYAYFDEINLATPTCLRELFLTHEDWDTALEYWKANIFFQSINYFTHRIIPVLEYQNIKAS
jgi:hypothetical protein